MPMVEPGGIGASVTAGSVGSPTASIDWMASPNGTRIPLIIDVDTGIDDSLALLYACASPEADLVAVTCVAGNVDARQVAENTRAVLELAGREDVEVALGREVPLVR